MVICLIPQGRAVSGWQDLEWRIGHGRNMTPYHGLLQHGSGRCVQGRCMATLNDIITYNGSIYSIYYNLFVFTVDIGAWLKPLARKGMD